MIYSTLINAFDVTITQPKQNDVWQRNQTENAQIEWLQGDKPTVPANFPSALDLYYVDASSKSKIEQLTNFDPSSNARWVFSPANPVSINLTDGNYQVLLVNSNNQSDIAYTPTFSIKGGPSPTTPPSTWYSPKPVDALLDSDLTHSSSSVALASLTAVITFLFQ